MQRIMKLTLLLVLGIVFTLSANVRAQDQMVTLKVSGSTFPKVIAELKRQTNLDFFYSMNEIDITRPISLDVKNERVDDVLHLLLGDAFSWEYQNNMVVIKPVYAKDDDNKKEKNIVLKGVVHDKKKQPIPGVTVLVKGTSVGVTTDVNGEFTLSLADTTKVSLMFSFIGMKTQVRPCSEYNPNKKWIITMEDEVQEMDEVVVTGYQSVKKSNMAGSVSTVKAEDLVLNGTQTLEQALQGKLPGVVVTNTSGLVGTRQKVRVRGTSTLLGSQEPVWVVDGIIQEDPLPFKAEELTLFGQDADNVDMIRNFVGSAIAWLNPADIKDVTVLKDASATAIYGVKAANGVIVITTKKGEKGRLSLGYSGNFSIGSKVTYDKMNLMNSKERVDVSREIFDRGLVSTRGLQPIGYQGVLKSYLEEKISYEEFNRQVKYLETVNTNWFDILFENPFSHSHNLSISGGSGQTTYYFSFGMNNQNGTAKGNDSKSYNGSLTLTTTFWEKLQLSGRISGSVSETNGFNKVDPYTYASTTSRVIPCYDEEGDLLFYKDKNRYDYNVIHELNCTGNTNTTNSLNFSLSVNWEMVKGLRFESTFGYNYSSSHGETYATERSNYIATKRGYEFGAYGPEDVEYRKSKLPHGGMLTTADNRNMNYTWRNAFSYVRNFGRHLLTVMVGQEMKSSKYDGMSQTIWGYLPERGKMIVQPPALIEDLVGNPLENSIYNDINQTIADRTSNTLSFYGAMTYTFDERYVLNASLRTDASNRFGQDKSARYQPVWSVGLRWNMGREHFMTGQDFLNELSLRASFGYQGNVVDNAGPDLIAYIPSGNQGISTATGEYLMKIRSLPNPKLRWEKNKTLNLGADFVFWKSKISGSFEYYHKWGEDIIVNRQVPYENGILSMPMNGGTMENYGWELSFSFSPVRTKDFIWTLGFNTSKNYNEITSTLETNKSWETARSGGLNMEGYPVSAFWAFEFAGLNPENGQPLFNLEGMENNPLAETDATQYMKYMGKLDPDFTAGVNTSFRYKQLTLSANFNLSVGGKKFLAPVFTSEMINDTPDEYLNLPKDMINRWRKPGDELITDIPSLPYYGVKNITLPANQSGYPYKMYNFTDVRVARASFLRCNNISLAYNINNKAISKFAQNIGLNFSVSNPFIIVSRDYKGVDPEVATGAQPIARNYTFSVNISF